MATVQVKRTAAKRLNDAGPEFRWHAKLGETEQAAKIVDVDAPRIAHEFVKGSRREGRILTLPSPCTHLASRRCKFPPQTEAPCSLP